jgi:hypothetical protein
MPPHSPHWWRSVVKDSGLVPCEYRDLDHGKFLGVGKMMVIFDDCVVLFNE